MTEPISTPGDAAATATTSETPLLAAERVRKIYRTGAGEVWALRDVDLEVRAGEFVAVMGPSGSGKTTLLNCLSGLDDIDAGRVMFDGRSLHDLNDAERTRSRASSMGFVFQSFNLIPVLSAVENVEVPLLLGGVHRKEARRRATETLERVGLGHRTDHRPNELSGGEQQRVTIARALAGRPRVVWADEPTGALDSESAEEVMQLMGELHREGLTLMLVTHDPTVGALAQRMIRMRDGVIVTDGQRLSMVAVVLFVALCIPFAVVLARSPLIRHLSTRHAFGRPVEALLVIAGSLLGTAIITGSLVVGDTINRSIRAAAYDQLGPIDELVSVPLPDGPTINARLRGFSAPSVDGVLELTSTPAAVVRPGRGGGTQPRAQLLEVDFAAARGFGGDRTATGITGSTPRQGKAAVTTDLAHKLDLRVGSRILAFAGGGSVPLTVDRVLPRRGVAGFWTLDSRQQSYNVFVAPGTIAGLSATAAAATEPPQAMIAISNVGGVEAGAARTSAVVTALTDRLAGLSARPRPVKRDLLERADAAGDSLSQLYFTIGMFAVAAGILLLVNVFVMLADERRSELGMLRAMGMRRRTLIGALASEGWLYAVPASALGALLGIGFGWLIAWRADQILGSGREVTALHLSFTFEWSTVVTGLVIGFAIALVTVLVASVRIARFNVIQAIRDIHAPARRRPRRRAAWAGLAIVPLGAALTAAGVAGPDPYALMAGPMLVAVGLAPGLARFLRARPVYTGVSIVVLAWAVGCFAVISALDATIEIPLFLLQGLSLTAASVYLVTAYLGGLGGVLERGSGGALSARLGIAYPLARRFRTAMTLGMFAVIVLTLVYMSEVSYMNRGRTDEIAHNLAGGFGIDLLSNPSDPVTVAELRAVPDVTRVAALGYVGGEFTTAVRGRTAWPVTGFDETLAAAPPHLRRLGRYRSDQAAWRAVAEDPSLVIVDDFFLQTPGGPTTKAAGIGDRVVMHDPLSGRSHVFRVAAIAENDFVGSGAFVSEAALRDVFRERAVPSRFFVAASSPAATARHLREKFVANGADAQTVRSIVATAESQSSGFFTLMQQFVGAGLLVGIAGVGVVMFRAVRERRREVGVLRSLGFQPASVARAFMFEAGFLALLGVMIGVAIALVAAYVLAASGADFAAGYHFGIPVTEVLVIVAVALVPTVLAAALPARQASHIEPAVALRVRE